MKKIIATLILIIFVFTTFTAKAQGSDWFNFRNREYSIGMSVNYSNFTDVGAIGWDGESDGVHNSVPLGINATIGYLYLEGFYDGNGAFSSTRIDIMDAHRTFGGRVGVQIPLYKDRIFIAPIYTFTYYQEGTCNGEVYTIDNHGIHNKFTPNYCLIKHSFGGMLKIKCHKILNLQIMASNECYGIGFSLNFI